MVMMIRSVVANVVVMVFLIAGIIVSAIEIVLDSVIVISTLTVAERLVIFMMTSIMMMKMRVIMMVMISFILKIPCGPLVAMVAIQIYVKNCASPVSVVCNQPNRLLDLQARG